LHLAVYFLPSRGEGGQKAARGELCRIIRDLGTGIIRNECGYAFLVLLCGEQTRQNPTREGLDTRCTAAAPMMSVIRVYDEAGNAIETHQHAGEFKEW